MANRRNLLVIALASVLVGMVAGVGVLQYAEVVAFGGADPNVANESVLNSRISRVRIHSFWNILRRTPVERADPEDQNYGAAPNLPEAQPGCEGLTGQRLTKCNAGTKVMNETAR